jgi:hypothetical protein
MELWLPIGAAAFYIYDSVCLLWQNELLYIWDGVRWQVRGGSTLRLAGRRVHVSNLLQPQRLQFLVRWSEADTRSVANGTAAITETYQALRVVRFIVLLLALLLLCALPLVSWLYGAGLPLLGFYLLVVAALLAVYRARHLCALAKKSFWALAFDGLACAPFAINLVRKVSQRRGLAGNPLLFAQHYFDHAARQQVASIVTARVQEELASNRLAAERKLQLETLLQNLPGTFA